MSHALAHRWRNRTLLALAAAALWAERAASRFWPVLCACAALAAVPLLAGGLLPPLWLHVPLLAASFGAIVLLTRRAVGGFLRPSMRQAEQRLEQDSGLRHRPFAVLRDRPAAGEGEVWDAHRRRAEAALARLRVGAPRPVLAARDPYALRSAALLLLAAGLFAAGPQAGARLARAILPGMPDLFGGAAPLVQIWAQPPAYTGLGPVFLPAGGGAATLPTGSKLTASLTGGPRRPRLHVGSHSQKFAAIGNDSFQAQTLLSSSTTLRISRFFSDIGRWEVTILPNDPPVAAWTQAPASAEKSASVRLPWTVSQRWGVASLSAELRPDGRAELAPIRVHIDLPGMPRAASGAETLDLSSNPYAGLSLRGVLRATDVSGQQGESKAAIFTLPSRPFKDPLARAIADLRRRLALNPAARDEAQSDLRALAETLPAGSGKSGLFLNMTSVASLLTADRSQTGFDEAEARLWTVALALDGALPDANAAALADAREQLRRALEAHPQGRMADADLAKRLQALREALGKRLQDIARQAVEQGALQKFDPGAQHLSSSAMDRVIRQMEQAAREGRMDEARQRMAELEKMLDQLQNAKIMTQEQAREQAERSRHARKQLGAVQDLARRETGLLDHAQSRAATPSPSGPRRFPGLDVLPPGAADQPSDQGQATPSPPGADDQARQSDTRTQNALRKALGALQQALRDSSRKPPDSLDRAGQAMGEAANAFAGHEDRMAEAAVGRAIAALQQGGKDMEKQMSQQGGGQMQLSLQPGGAQNAGGEDGEAQQGDGQEGGGRDPLGRRLDGNGQIGDDPSLRVPDRAEEARSRAIQDELRRRGANRQRPQDELDYIDRLLKPF